MTMTTLKEINEMEELTGVTPLTDEETYAETSEEERRSYLRWLTSLSAARYPY